MFESVVDLEIDFNKIHSTCIDFTESTLLLFKKLGYVFKFFEI